MRSRRTCNVIFISSLMILWGAGFVFASERTWTRSQILAVTDQEAQRLGYAVDEMSVSFNEYNSAWQEHMKANAGLSGMPDIETQLQHRKSQDYWAVYYGPLKEQFGGDLWVFVDRQTGEVLGAIRGK